MNPNSLITSKILDLVRSHEKAYTVYRHTDESDDDTLGAPSSNDYEDIGTRDLALHTSDLRVVERPEGDIQSGSLMGAAEASTDIEIGDRIDYGQYRYEITRADDHPPANPTVTQLALERV